MLMFNQPRRHPLVLTVATLAALILACSSSDDKGDDSGDDGNSFLDPDYTISELRVEETSIGYIAVMGSITVNDDYSLGTYAEVRFYQDEYETLIADTTEYIGEDLEEEGMKQAFEITYYEVYVGADYELVCATFRADDSDLEEWTEAGCMAGQRD